MRVLSIVFCACLILPACAIAPVLETPTHVVESQFADRIIEHSEALGINGVAYAVIKDGEVLVSRGLSSTDQIALGPDDVLRFASVTKALTGVILLQLNEEGRLDLDASASAYLPDQGLDPAITIRHLASHTSEGAPGSVYVYGTQRYALLETVIEAASGTSFAEALRQRILIPAGMTWYDSPFLGSHAGFESSVNDMARFAAALQRGQLLSARSMKELSSPYILNDGSNGRVSVGFFTQEIGGIPVVWSFGQDDPDHSSALFLFIPDENLSLVLLANTDELSNPYRLLMGDIRVSPFAQAFFDIYAPEIGAQIDPIHRTLADILTAIWIEDYDTAIAAYDDLKRVNADAFKDPHQLVLHFIATSAQQSPDPLIDAFNDIVLAAYPHNKWSLLGAAEYLEQTGRDADAYLLFQRIIDLPNQEDDFLRRLFLAWSYGGQAKTLASGNPEKAIELLDLGLQTGVSRQTADDLQRMRDGLMLELDQ